MKLNTKTKRKGFTLVELLVVMAIIAVLASIATPIVFTRLKDADRTKAVSNAKAVGRMIIDFELEEGVRPGEQVASEGEVEGAQAGSSNDVFRQILQRLSKVRSEANFYAKSKISKEPDNDIGDSSNNFAQAMEKGECGFSYVDAPDARSGAPLMAAPYLDGNGTFDFEAYNGKAVVLSTDQSVNAYDINEENDKVEVKIGGSKVDMFSTANKVFRTAPKIKFPLAR